MWYAIKSQNHPHQYIPMLLHFCTLPLWFWTRAEAQAECDRRNAELQQAA